MPGRPVPHRSCTNDDRPPTQSWLPSSKQAVVDTLLEALDERTSVVLVGEPGVGKTCVLRALRHRIPAAGFRLTYSLLADRRMHGLAVRVGPVHQHRALTCSRRFATVPFTGDRCAARSQTVFACVDRDRDGPSFTLPGWTKPIHDHTADPTHGRIDLVSAIAVSCNVYFGQLGLALGPAPIAELRAAGVGGITRVVSGLVVFANSDGSLIRARESASRCRAVSSAHDRLAGLIDLDRQVKQVATEHELRV